MVGTHTGAAGHYVAAGPGHIIFYVTTIHPGRHAAAPDKRLFYSFMPLWYTFCRFELYKFFLSFVRIIGFHVSSLYINAQLAPV